MTRETVAVESPRYSERDFKLTDCAGIFPRERDGIFFARVMGCSVNVVWHRNRGRARGAKCTEEDRQASPQIEMLCKTCALQLAVSQQIFFLTLWAQRVLDAP